MTLPLRRVPPLSRRVRPLVAMLAAIAVASLALSPALKSAPSLTSALEGAGNADHGVVTLPDASHLFQPAVSGAVTEYGTLPQTFTADFLPLLVDWVTQHAAAAP